MNDRADKKLTEKPLVSVCLCSFEKRALNSAEDLSYLTLDVHRGCQEIESGNTFPKQEL